MQIQIPKSAQRYLVVSSCLLMSFSAANTKADVVTVEFTSTVDFVQNLPVFGISPSIGTVATGEFSYDTDAVDLDPGDPKRGVYRSGQLSVSVAGSTFTNELTPQLVVFDNGPPGNDLFGIAAGTAAGDTNILVNGAPMEGQIALGFSEPSGGLTSDDLPSSAILTSLNTSQFNILDPDGNRLVTFSNVRTLTAVPEPSSFLQLSLIGFVGLGHRWFRGRATRSHIKP